MGLMSSNPGSGSRAGRSSSVTVSPTLESATFLMLAIRKPTSPAASSSTSDRLGGQHPQGLHVEDACRWTRSGSSASCAASPGTRAVARPRRDRDRTRNRRSAPAAGSAASPCGGGTRLTIASRTSGTPCPVLALMSTALVASSPTALLDHLPGARHVGAGQVDFVDDRNDLQPVIDGQIGIGQRLRLDALTWRPPPAARPHRIATSAPPHRKNPHGRGYRSG